jgi:DNA-binding LytR/AlgR family response regulator
LKYNQQAPVTHIIISKGTEFLRVPQDKLVYISSEGNYSNVVTVDNRQRLVTYQLGQLEGMIGEQLGSNDTNFLRIGRSLIINIDYIYLIDISKQQLVLSDCAGCYHELSASREVLIKLKAYMESLNNR